MGDHALITFALFAYKQEPFVREAIEGALAQTYEPLEIILSDDCSPDRTFEIMKEMAAAYRGPHHIVLNRNERNLGVGAHVNRVVSLAQGELIVAAAGDDVSLPDRTQCLYDAWVSEGKTATSLYSDCENIDEHSVVIESAIRGGRFCGSRREGVVDIVKYIQNRSLACIIPGCAHAWSRRAFLQEGPLNDDVWFEDKTIGFRSLVAGSFVYVPRRLVRYRRHSSNLWGIRIQDKSRVIRIRKELQAEFVDASRWIGVLNNYRKDVETFVSQGVLSPEERELILRAIRWRLKVKRGYIGMYRYFRVLLWAWALIQLASRFLYVRSGKMLRGHFRSGRSQSGESHGLAPTATEENSVKKGPR